MQNSALFCLIPICAVIDVPLLYFPSIISIPSDNALTILFLLGKFLDETSLSGGYSLIIAPPLFIISSNSFIFSLGYMLLNPLPITAIVFPFAFKQLLCACESIPNASPLIILILYFDSSSTISFVIFSPSFDEFLEPITAIPKLFNIL